MTEVTAQATYYSRPLHKPVTRLDGLCNFVQIIINQLEAGRPHEGLLTAVDLLDTLRGTANPFASVTEGKDTAVLDALKQQHAREMADAIAKAAKAGVEQGRREERQAVIERLGLAA